MSNAITLYRTSHGSQNTRAIPKMLLFWPFLLWLVVASGCGKISTQQPATTNNDTVAQPTSESRSTALLRPTVSSTGRPAITAPPQETEQAITTPIPPLATPSPPSTEALPATVPPIATDSAQSAESAPAPAPVGTVVYYEESISLPTYPFERYQSDEIDPKYNWPYKRFDVERFRAEAPSPELRTYRLLVLENAYLKILILPELGGRIWQVIHKPTGAPLFYQNSVVKPTHWGLANQLGWLALGGIEWGLPVIEHGYDWGTPWGYIPLQHSEDLAAVTVFTPSDGRLLTASITISLRAGTAAFDIEPTLTNLADRELAFSYWHTAMLAPGSGKHPSSSLRFLLPTDSVSVHSTGDTTLPAPGGLFSWPIFHGRDFSQLGEYTQYLGFFEAPTAHGPFVAIYDPEYDVGVVRAFPPDVTRGSKVFTLGWQDALSSANYTDDDSSYVELHSGLAPTFDDQFRLPAGDMISWREVWYPVVKIGTVSAANELVALSVEKSAQDEDTVALRIYGVRPIDGIITVDGTSTTIPFQARPDTPFEGELALDEKRTDSPQIQLQDGAGHLLLRHPLLLNSAPPR